MRPRDVPISVFVQMRAKLDEAERQIALHVQNKARVEREMKQAFLRSVCTSAVMSSPEPHAPVRLLTTGWVVPQRP